MNQSIMKAAVLLENLAKLRKPVPLKVIAQDTGLDKATAYRLLSSLLKINFVQKIGGESLYGLGPGFLYFAEIFGKNLTLRDRALPYLRTLVEATEETAIYCEKYHEECCVTVERWDSPHQTRTFMETGIPRPLYVGSSGQAILAMLSDREILSVIGKRPLLKCTPFTPTSIRSLQKKLEQTRRQGYAVSIQERHLYTAGVAAPVLNDKGVVGSLGIIGPAERVKDGGIKALGHRVKTIARQLSVELGFRIDVRKVGCAGGVKR